MSLSSITALQWLASSGAIMSDEIPTYFQFPLRYITTATEAEFPLVMESDCIEYASWLWIRKTHEAAARFNAEEYRRNHPEWRVGKIPVSSEFWLAAANVLGYAHTTYSGKNEQSRQANMRASLERIQYKAQHKYEIDRQNGGWQVRLRQDIFWDVANWPLPKVKLLCSLYAVIGDAGHKRVTHGLLAALVAGYDSPKAAAADPNPRPMLPKSTIREWLGEFHFRKLFTVCLHGNNRIYSIRCSSDEELARFVLAEQSTCRTKRPPLIRTKNIRTAEKTL